ncbi:hypothetical protein HMPREF1532_02938 [Bacteroides salyersiae WAL 10018 = DSM 18765 = JCM 12988]|nr:hypothetical protein HMPREF1532_02938 [Bacteroides salyersiae WAL 10018 = DSM 18765 = JCM 12988]
MINQYLNRKNKYKEEKKLSKKKKALNKKALNKNTSQRIDIISIREIEWIDTE